MLADEIIREGDSVEIVHLNGEVRSVTVTRIGGDSIWVKYGPMQPDYKIQLRCAVNASMGVKRLLGRMITKPPHSWKLADLQRVRRGVFGVMRENG